MKQGELLYPFYCFNCGNLAFVHRRPGEEPLLITDFISLEWKLHSCFKIDQLSFAENPHIQKLSTLDWGSDRLPFAHRLLPSLPKQRRYSAGVVILIPPDSETDDTFTVLTPENSIIEIKSAQKTKPETCGLVIEITDHVRIGKGKFRINAIESYVVPDYLRQSEKSTRDLYQISASSTDPERLETFIDRLLKAFVGQNIAPISVFPLKVTRSNNILTHHRQITFPSESDFYAIIEKINIPDFIELSAKQIKTPELEIERKIDVKQE